VPDFQRVDFPDVLDAPLVNKEIESIEDKIEECVSNEDDNSTDDEGESSEGEQVISRGSDYDSEVECNVPFWVTYFQQVDESEVAYSILFSLKYLDASPSCLYLWFCCALAAT